MMNQRWIPLRMYIPRYERLIHSTDGRQVVARAAYDSGVLLIRARLRAPYDYDHAALVRTRAWINA